MDILDVIREFTETLSTIGDEATATALKQARDSCTNPKFVKEIFNIVSNEMGFKISKIDDLKSRTDERKVILAFVVYFSYKKLRTSYLDMCVLGCVSLNNAVQFTRYKQVIEEENNITE